MNRIRNSIAIKSIAGIVLLLTIFCVIVGQIGYQGFLPRIIFMAVIGNGDVSFRQMYGILCMT